MMRTTSIASVVTAMALGGCIDGGKAQTTFDPPYPERSANGDSLLAVYEGRIPCTVANCQKLKVQLVLYRDPNTQAPASYWLGVVGAAGNNRVVTRGTWALQRGVQNYPDSAVYALDAAADSNLRYFWRVNEDILLVLDQDLRPRVGNGAWGYMLSRDTTPYGPRSYRYDKRAKRFVD